MGDLFNIAHELGDLSEYDSSVTDGGQLSVAAAAALGATGYGMQCVIDDVNAMYGQADVSSSSGKLRFRFYIDPNGLAMAGADRFIIASGYGSAGTLVSVYLQRTGATYEVGAQIYDDAGGGSYSAWTVVTDAEHYVEIYLERASSAVASDGSLEIYIDGALEDTVAGEDNYDWFADCTHLRLGPLAELDVGTTGTLYLDEFRANDDGSAIGVCTTLAASAKTLGGEPVVTLVIGGHTLTAFVVGYEFEERCQRAGGLRIWLDNRGDEFDDLAVGYPGLVRGAAVDLRRGISVEGAPTTKKLPRTWIDGLRYVFVEGTAMLRLDCIDWWDRLDRYRYATGQLWVNTEVRTIVAAVLGQVGLTVEAGDFGVLINFGVSIRRGGDEAVRDAMSRVEEYLYSDVDGNVLHKELDPAEGSGYTYDWSAGGGANHPLMKGTEISEQSPRFNRVMVVGGGNWEYSGTVNDVAEQALVDVRMRTLSDRYLSSDVECTERAQAELRYWQAQKLSGKVIARPHFTLALYDMITVAAPAWGGPARVGRVMGWQEEYGRLRGVWEQRIIVGEVAYLAMGSSGLGYGSVVGEHIDPETGLIVAAYKIRMEGEIVVAMYAQVDGVGTSATHETIGYDVGAPEAMIEFISRTYDGVAHGGVATVTLAMDTLAGTVSWGGATHMIMGTLYQEMTEQAADPAAPGLNRARVYLRDDGGGNTQLCARFNTGAIVVLATEGATLESTFLKLDCTNDPLTAGLEINAATAGEPVLTLLTTDDDPTSPYLDLTNSGTPMPYILRKDGTRFFHTYGTGNFFQGINAGNFTLTVANAINNLALGENALASLTTGYRNVAIGRDALAAATTANLSVAIGERALAANTTGTVNFALGRDALVRNISGHTNVAIGSFAMEFCLTGYRNVAVGSQCLGALISGFNNVALGYDTLVAATTAEYNTALGSYALMSLVGGTNNVAIGRSAMYGSVAASYNVAVGGFSLYTTEGDYNVGIGVGAAGHWPPLVTNFSYGAFVGAYAGEHHETAQNSVCLGSYAGQNITTGGHNLCVGYKAGDLISTGVSNIIIGYDVDPPLAASDYHLNIGDLITGQLDTYRLAFGTQHVADKYGQVVQASGMFAGVGDAQGTIQMCARRLVDHSDADWYELFLDGAGERMTLLSDVAWSFEALVVGATIGCAKSFGFKIVGVIRNVAGVMTLLDHDVDVLYNEHELGWSARASADDTNDALLIEVQDAESGGDEVQWVATVRTAEVRNEL